MIGDILFEGHKLTTAMRLENNEHFESNIFNIDLNYCAEDTINTGFFHKLYRPEVIENS